LALSALGTGLELAARKTKSGIGVQGVGHRSATIFGRTRITAFAAPKFDQANAWLARTLKNARDISDMSDLSENARSVELGRFGFAKVAYSFSPALVPPLKADVYEFCLQQ
jgi:hypothetical protein